MNLNGTGLPIQDSTTNCELYLLIILIKISILMVVAIVRMFARLCVLHNKRVIDKYNRATIAKLQFLSRKAGDLEAGLPNI